MPILSIFGSSDWPQEGKYGDRFVEETLSKQVGSGTTVFISDKNSHIDRHIYEWCMKNGVMIAVFQTNEKCFGKTARGRTDDSIIANSYRFLAFWDGKSEDVRQAIEIACKRLIPGCVYSTSGKEYLLDPQQIGTKTEDFIRSILEESSGDNGHEKRRSVL